jgi:peptidoglycan/LPS O-acetylase OafA/YrhL
MKSTKTMIIALISLTLTFVAGVAMYSTMSEIKPIEYIIYAAVGLIVIFGLVKGLKNLKDEKKGLTTEDELSQKIKLRAGANAFTASFYLWAMILLFTIDSNINNEIILGIGIAGMGLIFIGSWLYYNNKGIDDGNPN